MSQQDLLALIRRAATDGAFRQALEADFETAAAANGLSLTPDEITALKHIDLKQGLGVGWFPPE